MIRIKYSILLFLLLNLIGLNAQKTMDYTKEEFQTKSKDQLIEIAIELLKEKHPEVSIDLNDFDSRAWSDKYGATKVIFRRAIRYVSNETENSYFDIKINLDTKEIMPFDDKELLFYTSSKKADKTIRELKEKGLLPNKNLPDIEYTITENAEHYLISCFDDLHEIDKNLAGNDKHPYLSKTIVNKNTGEILFFKGENPFYFLRQITSEHYYKKSLYVVLKEENIANKRNTIIEIASSILKEKQPNLKLNSNDFEIVILGNYKDIIVKYRRFIRFEKSHEKTVFDLAVNIITKEIVPFNSSKISFYIPSLADKKAINTIQNILPLELSANMEHTILENEDYFWIASLSQKAAKKYIINKKHKQIIWSEASNNFQTNNREDLTLEEHYKRMNGFYSIDSGYNTPLIAMAVDILKEKQFIPNINLADYSVAYKASKNEVEINFTRLVTYLPLRHKEKPNLNYNLDVSLINKTVAQNSAQFYFPTKEDASTTELVKTKLIASLKDFDTTYYPIEIIEEKDFFTIRTSEVSSFRKDTVKQYRMDKKTKTIEVIVSPTYFYPSPAMEPRRLKEIKN
ncbi:MAG: hypothetical protein V3U92_19415 [Cellulophaga sp.]